MIKGCSIRECREEEAEALLSLWQQAEATVSVTDTIEDVRRALGHSSAMVLVAEGRGGLVGSVIGSFDGWRGNIYRLAVLPEYRRQGVARALVEEVEARFAEQGAKRITALVEWEHPWATGFWDSVGYKQDARIVRYVGGLGAPLTPNTMC